MTKKAGSLSFRSLRSWPILRSATARAICIIICCALPLGWIGNTILNELVISQQVYDLQQEFFTARSQIEARAGALVLQEANKPADNWKSFYQPQISYNALLTPFQQPVYLPSPMVAGAESPILLHFQLDRDGHCTSPQLPTLGQQDLVDEYYPHDLTEVQQLLDSIQKRTEYIFELGQQLPSLKFIARVKTENDFQTEDRHQSAAQTKNQEDNQLQNQLENYQTTDITNFLPKQSIGNDSQQLREQAGKQAILSRRYNLFIDEIQNSSNDKIHFFDQTDSNITGSMRGFWLNDDLILLRRVITHGETGQQEYLQGALLDTDATANLLLADLHELFPNLALNLQAVSNEDPDQLANLPYVLRSNADVPIRPETAELLQLIYLSAFIALAGALSVAIMSARLAERRAAFVSAVTHELRTPLTALSLHADLLNDDRIAERRDKRMHSLDIMRTQSARLNALITNVLDHARLERKGRPNCQAIDLHSFISRHRQSWHERLALAGIKLEITTPQQEMTIIANHDALLRILDNLIDNAGKYASDGKLLKISWHKHGSRGSRGCISLRDYGPGYHPKARAWERSAELAAGHAPGIGLGLTLCRRLARAMGGKLRVVNLDPGLQTSLCLRLAKPNPENNTTDL